MKQPIIETTVPNDESPRGGVTLDGQKAVEAADAPQRQAHGLDRSTFHGAACEAINYVEASISAAVRPSHSKRPVADEDHATALAHLDAAEYWIRQARANLIKGRAK